MCPPIRAYAWLVGEDSDVDTFSGANEAEHWITENAIPPRIAVAVPDKNCYSSVGRSTYLTNANCCQENHVSGKRL